MWLVLLRRGLDVCVACAERSKQVEQSGLMPGPSRSGIVPDLWRDGDRGCRDIGRDRWCWFGHKRHRRRNDVGLRLCREEIGDRKSTRLNSSHSQISYAVFCLKKKKETY